MIKKDDEPEKVIEEEPEKGPKKEEKKSGIPNIPRTSTPVKEEKKVEKDEIPEIKEKVKTLEQKFPEVEKKVEDHGERIKALEERVAKNEEDVDEVRGLAKEAIRICKYAVQWWWPLLVAVLGIVALMIFTFANIFFAILTISAVIITTIAAIVSWYYFRYKPNQQE